MKPGNWESLSSRRLVLFKLLYDSYAAVAALVLAFLTRLALVSFEQVENRESVNLGDIYLSFFLKHVGLFTLLTIGGLALAGFYRSAGRSDDEPWRPIRVILGVSIGPILWSLCIFYSLDTRNEWMFPRGVTLLTWIYLLAFLAAPRIIKYLVLNHVVFEVHHHRRRAINNVLVIGGAGYIGSQLTRDLITAGYRVRVLDSMLFGDESLLALGKNPDVDIIVGDFRNVETVVRAMRGIDAVVHLAGIVGDPACSLDDDFTIDINLTATKMLAEVCKAFKVERLVFASSCSVYGASSSGTLSETSALNPVSLYARTKIAGEKVLLQSQSQGFSPTILRFATLFGFSPRPRFDLFINLVAAQAFFEKKFTVHGGSQWRPFVHVRDVSRTILEVLRAPAGKVAGQIFNVGSDANCLTIGEAAEFVRARHPETEVEYNESSIDLRNYRVSFEKIRSVLGLELNTGLREGIEELFAAFEDGRITDYRDSAFSNLKQTERVLSAPNGSVNGSWKLEPSYTRSTLEKIVS